MLLRSEELWEINDFIYNETVDFSFYFVGYVTNFLNKKVNLKRPSNDNFDNQSSAKKSGISSLYILH